MINTDVLENLHYRESIRHPHNQWYRGYPDWRHDVNGQSPYKILDRILANNIGKSFSLAFHYFCTKVPKYQQRLFLEVFTENRYWSYMNFYIDSDGNIQIKELLNKPKGPYRVYSDDYKVMWRDTKSPRNWYTKKELVEQIPYFRIREDFEPVIFGTVSEYDSKKHPEYQAYKRKQQHKYKMLARQVKKDREEKYAYVETLMRKQKADKKAKEREINDLKRQAAGFDEESFKGEFYHGRKNKKK